MKFSFVEILIIIKKKNKKKLYLMVEVDTDEFSLLVAVEQRLSQVKRACLVHTSHPVLIHLLLPATKKNIDSLIHTSHPVVIHLLLPAT